MEESLTTGSAASTDTTGTATTDTAATQPAVDTTVTQPITQPAGSQKPPEKPVKTGWDYKTDQRWGKVWKSEGDIIQGYKLLDDVLEQKYKPTFNQMEDFKKKIKDSGIELEQIDEYIKSYQGMIDPNNPTNQVLNLLRELADDDITAQELDLALSDLQEKKLQRKYAGLNKDQREAAIQRDREIAELKSWKQKFEDSESEKQSLERGKQNQATIKTICQGKGFELTDEIWNSFIDHCITNKVPTQYMVQEFRNKFDDALDKAHENKIKSSMLEQQKEANRTKVKVKTNQVDDAGKKQGFEERLKGLLTSKPK